MSTAVEFLDIEKTIGILETRNRRQNPLESTSLLKLISSFLSQRTFSVSVEGAVSTRRGASRFCTVP
jgi:hypothetical protein